MRYYPFNERTKLRAGDCLTVTIQGMAHSLHSIPVTKDAVVVGIFHLIGVVSVYTAVIRGR